MTNSIRREKLRILILSNEILQIGMSAANRTMAYAKALAMSGNDVKILSPFGFPTRTQKNIPEKTIFDPGFEYSFLSYMPKHPGEGRNIILLGIIYLMYRQMGFLKLYSLLLFKRKSYDLIFVYEFPVVDSLMIRLFSIGKPLFHELCEVPIPKKTSNQLVKRRLREYLNLFWAQGFLVISDNLGFYAKNLRRKFTILKVPILVDQDISVDNDSGIQVFSPSIMHIGTLSPSKDFILYVMQAYGIAMQQLPDEKKFHFYLTGELYNAVDHAEISRVIEKYEITNWVHFIGYQQEKHLHSLLIKTSLAVVYKGNNEINHFGFPTKIGAYLLAGVPVVISPVGEMQKYIKDGYNGFIVGLDDLNGLSNIMANYFLNLNAFKHMQKHAKETALNEFSLRIHGERMTAFFQESIKK